MADRKISELPIAPDGGAPAPGDLVPITRGTASYRAVWPMSGSAAPAEAAGEEILVESDREAADFLTLSTTAGTVLPAFNRELTEADDGRTINLTLGIKNSSTDEDEPVSTEILLRAGDFRSLRNGTLMQAYEAYKWIAVVPFKPVGQTRIDRSNLLLDKASPTTFFARLGGSGIGGLAYVRARLPAHNFRPMVGGLENSDEIFNGRLRISSVSARAGSFPCRSDRVYYINVTNRGVFRGHWNVFMGSQLLGGSSEITLSRTRGNGLLVGASSTGGIFFREEVVISGPQTYNADIIIRESRG